MNYLGLKVLIFLIFIDSTVGIFIDGSLSTAYAMIQFFSGMPTLFLLRRFMFNYLWKPRMNVNYIMEHYYS